MLHTKKFHYGRNYEFVSTNQHGDRFKKVGHKKLSVDRLSVKTGIVSSLNAVDMSTLIIFSDRLDTPVRWDVDEKEYYIEIVSLEQLKESG